MRLRYVLIITGALILSVLSWQYRQSVWAETSGGKVRVFARAWFGKPFVVMQVDKSLLDKVDVIGLEMMDALPEPRPTPTSEQNI